MPIVAAVAVAAIGGLVQAWNAEKGRKGAAAQQKKIEELYNSIKPPDYDLSISDPPELHQEALQSPKFSAAIQSPTFDASAFTPEKLKSVGEFVPQIAPMIKEAAPTIVKMNEDMKKGRSAQLTALDKLTKVGQGGFDPEYAQKIQQAEQKSQQEARAQQQTLADTYNRRGIGGSGLELAQAMQGNANAMNNAAQANQQAATDAYRNQLAALSQGASLGGQIFGQEQSLQAQNADIINAFNQRTSAAQQNWEQQNAATMNQAQAQNLANKQRIADTNVGNQNAASLADRSRMDELAKYNYANQFQNQQREDALSQQNYQNKLGERNYQNDVAQSLAAWKEGQKQQQNQNKQSIFNNQMAINAGKAGSYGAQGQLGISAAADQNQGIAGLTNAAMIGALAYNQKK